jgi:hypothetical protein
MIVQRDRQKRTGIGEFSQIRRKYSQIMPENMLGEL